MPRLTASFNVALSGDLRVNRSPADSLLYTTTDGDFQVEVALVRNGGASITLPTGQEIRVAKKLLISISREENSSPPFVVVDGRDSRDVTARGAWLEKRYPGYAAEAVKIANRVIRFFKYEMNTPRLSECGSMDASFQNPTWTDGVGNELEQGAIRLSSHLLRPPVGEALGEKDFTQDDDAALAAALRTDLDVDVYGEFLSDAQGSILDRKWRRAILEMAIACEVGVKEAFFARDSAAGAAYEYLEDKRKVSVRVMELIDGAARLAFGHSFKDEEPSTYAQLDHLFRARNRVAHRGEMAFLDDSNVKHQIDRATLAKWWASVLAVLKWIGQFR